MIPTTLVNKLTVVHLFSDGVSTSGPPDVCKSPNVPVPYTNVAYSRDLILGSVTVRVDGSPIALKDSLFSTSYGDEPGTGGGVVSGVNKGVAKFTNYSNDVFVEGRNVCRLTDPMLLNGNDFNTSNPAESQGNRPSPKPQTKQREVIPLVFVPGIMGTVLRLSGADPAGTTNGLPNIRWNPSSSWWMLNNVSGASGAQRKALLVGDKFNPGLLEPNDSHPVGNGWASLFEDYDAFLTMLQGRYWGGLGEVFRFPVYAFGYNWTDDSKNSGAKLAARIPQIIADAKAHFQLPCEKVILITHSMGGMVARSASELSGAGGSILGIVHGVQPVTGTPAAYWRIKAGFEHFGMTSHVLGPSGREVTPVLGNIPGGLELLPNKLHRTNGGAAGWLTVTDNGKTTLLLPKADPYNEIYRVPAVVKPVGNEVPSSNKYWGLADPNLLDPGAVPAAGSGNPNEALDAGSRTDPWSAFLEVLAIAEGFHDSLGERHHANTFCSHGTQYSTADVIEMKIQPKGVRYDFESYPPREFKGYFTSTKGNMEAVLQQPSGDGDGTVATSSGTALDSVAAGNMGTKVEHQPAYQNTAIQNFTFQAITTLAKKRAAQQGYSVGP